MRAHTPPARSVQVRDPQTRRRARVPDRFSLTVFDGYGEKRNAVPCKHTHPLTDTLLHVASSVGTGTVKLKKSVVLSVRCEVLPDRFCIG